MKRTLALKNSTDFQKILKRGEWVSGDFLSLYHMSNFQNKNFLGVAVGKKGLSSVQRNRIKRLIRESYRSIEEQLDIGYNIVVLWRSRNSYESATFDNIYSDIKKCLNKSGMII